MFRVGVGAGDVQGRGVKTIIAGLSGFFLLGVAGADELATQKLEYRKWDQKLNAVYAELKKELSEHLFKLVQAEQREWVDHKEHLASWESKARGREAATDPHYWEQAAGLTESRVDYLNAWRGVGEAGDWAGEYADGYGGWLRIVEKDGRVWFALEVVRGPTYHLGHIGGTVATNEGLGRFATQAEGEKAPTWLSFLNSIDGDGRIRIVSANASHFHGARAYFDGTYLRVGLLAPKEQSEVVEIAKRGGLPE